MRPSKTEADIKFTARGLVKPAPAQDLARSVRIDRRIGRYRTDGRRIPAVVFIGDRTRIIEHAAARSAGGRHFRSRIDRGVVRLRVAEAIGPPLRHRYL